MKSFKKVLIVFMTLVLLAVIIAFFLLSSGCSKAEGKKAEKKAPAAKEETVSKDQDKNDKNEEAVPVEVAQVLTGNISSFQLYNATIEAENTVDVYNKISGIIVSLKSEEGQHVKKGDLLAAIEDDDYRLEESGARSAFNKTEKEYKRSQQMYKDKLLSDNDFEQVKYNYEQAKIAWQRAKVRLNYTRIVAPISGIVSYRNIKNGDFLQMNTRVFSIVDMNTLITRVYIPEKNIANIRIKQKAQITSDALKDKNFQGAIKMISPVVDPTNGTVKVTIELKKYGKALKPGMFVKCHIITDTHRNTRLVTKKAVIYNGIQSVVFKVENGIAQKVILDLGFQDAENVEALNKNIKAGDKIITVGQYGLKDKDEVKITNNVV